MDDSGTIIACSDEKKVGIKSRLYQKYWHLKNFNVLKISLFKDLYKNKLDLLYILILQMKTVLNFISYFYEYCKF